jgi:hypothetical protein
LRTHFSDDQKWRRYRTRSTRPRRVFRVEEQATGDCGQTVWDWNVASRRVLEKLGFRETGRVERDAVYGDTLLTVREF